MAKAKKESVPKKSVDPELVARRRKVAINATLTLALLAGVGTAAGYLKGYIDRKALTSGEPPKVVLKDRPVWMSEFLADSITAPIRPDIAKSPFDHKVLVDAVEALGQNPWIKEIRSVRRTFTTTPGDTIELDCEYRAPIALVRYADHYVLVDNEGTVLPEQFTQNEIPRIVYGSDGKMNIRVIEGVALRPNTPGQKWAGDDLKAGLELVQLLYGQPYAEDILKVNVSNFQGRKSQRDPQLVLVTRFNPSTELRWGRPIHATDAFIEVSTAQKLNYLQTVYNKYKRVDAGQPWLDLRFDHILYPAQPEAQASASIAPH